MALVDHATNGVSITEYLSKLPKRRNGYQAKGQLLYFPRTETVMVPVAPSGNGRWSCVVVVGDDVYKPGGYSLDLSEREIETAIQVTPEMITTLVDGILDDAKPVADASIRVGSCIVTSDGIRGTVDHIGPRSPRDYIDNPGVVKYHVVHPAWTKVPPLWYDVAELTLDEDTDS